MKLYNRSYNYWDRPLAEANKVYRSRRYRDGLLTGIVTGVAIILMLFSAVFVLWTCSQ